MKKREIISKPGDIICIPLEGDLHTFGRILGGDNCAIYDFKTSDSVHILEDIIKSKILFYAWIDFIAIEDGEWQIIGNAPLEDKLKDFYPRYFNPAKTSAEGLAFYNTYKNEIEEASSRDWIGDTKTQIDFHGSFYIKQRILSCYRGEPYKFHKIEMDIFRKMTGVMLDKKGD